MQRALSAPGKLFLSGEYAVLWGGTARIAAVGPRSSALVRRRADREVHLVQEAGRVKGAATPLGVNWKGVVPEELRFVAWTADLALRAHGVESLGFEVAFGSGLAAPDGRKLGFGGSARAAVLCAEACRYILESPLDALKLALLAHSQVQQGRGSGGDVAAIFAGGTIRYRRYPLEALNQAAASGQLLSALLSAPPVELWRLPPLKVSLLYAFAGQSASTPGLITLVEQQLKDRDRHHFVERSDEWGAALEDGLVRGDFPAVVDAAAGLQALLAGLGPLETEPMRQVLALARTHGCAGKMSGAGGGDGCVLFAPDPQSAGQLLEALTTRGFLALPLTVEQGVRGENQPEPRLPMWLDS